MSAGVIFLESASGAIPPIRDEAADTSWMKLAFHPAFWWRMRHNMAKARVWKIVVDDFVKTGAFLRHGPGPTLAQPDTMPLANSLQNDFGPAILLLEIVARHRVPPQPSIHSQSSGFMMIGENRGILRGHAPAPAHGIFVAKIADDGKIRIPARGNANIGGRESVAPATARKHRGHGLTVEGNNQVSRRLRRACGRAPGSRCFPQKLAMREIAEIKLRVTPCSSHKIGTRDHRLCFQCLEEVCRPGIRPEPRKPRPFPDPW